MLCDYLEIYVEGPELGNISASVTYNILHMAGSHSIRNLTYTYGHCEIFLCVMQKMLTTQGQV